MCEMMAKTDGEIPKYPKFQKYLNSVETRS